MTKILMVGGVFDNEGGRPSGYFRKFHEAFETISPGTKCINGGSYDSLVSTLNELTSLTHLFWFADIPNSFAKLLPSIRKQNPGLILVQSKNNRLGKYSRDDLFGRMRDSGAEMLVEFEESYTRELVASVLLVHGEVVLNQCLDIPQVVNCIMREFIRINDLGAPMSGNIVVPAGDHPNAFGFVRKMHIHEGVDLFGTHGQAVHAIEDGEVVGIYDFTGKAVGSEWWNDTKCILVTGASGVINYGELDQNIDVKVGDRVCRGDVLGHLATVLKKDKGVPRTMLHLERYSLGTTRHINEWSLESPRPAHLCDPTILVWPR